MICLSWYLTRASVLNNSCFNQVSDKTFTFHSGFQIGHFNKVEYFSSRWDYPQQEGIIAIITIGANLVTDYRQPSCFARSLAYLHWSSPDSVKSYLITKEKDGQC